MSKQKQLLPMGVGERLKHEREERGESLEDVAASLRIDIAVMRALEDDRLEHIAPLYRRGYVRSYARYLELEAADTEELLQQIGNETPELHTVFPEAGHPRQAERWIKATSYVLASLLVGTLAWQFTYEAVRLSQERGKPEVSLAEDGSTSEPGQKAAGGHVNASIAALEGLQRKRSNTSGAGDQAWGAIRTAEQATAVPSTGDAGEWLLELAASGDSWVEITDARGKQLELDLVRGGTTKQYRGTAPFNIQFGRASALKLTVNGEPLDFSSYTVGDVTQVTLLGDGSLEGPGSVQEPEG